MKDVFFINIYKSAAKLGQSVQLVFQIIQHIRDENLMNHLISYFGCGYIKLKSKQELIWIDFLILIKKKLFLFYKIIGVKTLIS